MSDLPSDVDAENALIGSTLVIGGIDGKAKFIRPDHFSNKVNGLIWESMLDLQARGDPIDIITIADAHKGKITSADISEKLIGTPTSLHRDAYAIIVMTTGAKRKLAMALPKLSSIAYGNEFHDPATVIAEAMAEIESAGEGVEQFEREVWTAAELAALEIPADPWLLDGLVIEGGLNLIAGEFAAGKTFVALDLAIGAASAGNAWGRKVKPGRVIYFGADNSRSNLVRRIRDLSEGREIKAPKKNLIFDLSPIDLSQPSGFATIRAAIREYDAQVIVIDAMIRYLGGFDENSASDIGQVMARFREIANLTGCTFIFIHHLRKISGTFDRSKAADRIRGSGDFLGAVDSAIVLTTKGQGSNIVRSMIQVKSREAEEIDVLNFAMQAAEQSGLIITFEAGDPLIASETLGDTTANLMANMLQKSPGVSFTKADLRAELANLGIVEMKSRSDDRAFRILKSIPTITVARSGRVNVYVWDAMDE